MKTNHKKALNSFTDKFISLDITPAPLAIKPQPRETIMYQNNADKFARLRTIESGQTMATTAQDLRFWNFEKDGNILGRGRNRVSEKNVAKENKCVIVNKIWTKYLHLNCVKTLENPVSMLYRH